MGKGKGKKDVEKKLALAARKEAKQEKSARKRLAKEQGSTLDEQQQNDELDEVLQAYMNQEKSGASSTATISERDNPILESIDTTFPLPRANATLCDVEGEKRDYFYLFGGEYFDGVSNIFLDEILRYEVMKKEWKKIITVPRPNPRCAHSCISYKHNLYAFGGEVSVGDQFHHFRDLWKFDIRTFKWEEIMARNPPSARSGHAAFVWKNYMILFGGFFEAARETKWYNDVAVFNLQTEVWMDVPQSRLMEKPEPRSACNFSSFGNDKVLIHGGFSKMKSVNSSSETKVHSDAWILHLSPILQGKSPTWERWMSSTKGFTSMTPNGRAGTACISHKSQMIVFGGVIDSEQQNHKVDSIFYNSLMALDIEKRKWFPIRIEEKATSGAGGRRRRRKDDTKNETDVEEHNAHNDDGDNDDDSSSSENLEEENDDEMDVVDDSEKAGWDLEKLRANMFAFVDGDGNIVYERIDEEDEDEQNNKEEQKDDDDEEEEKEEEKEEEEDDKEELVVTVQGNERGNNTNEKQSKAGTVTLGTGKPAPTITSSSVMMLNPETNIPEVVERKDPLPRINASLLTIGHVLYLYGGVLEVGDREVTLDDMWCVDLRRREHWECLWPGTMHKQVWRGALFDDDDSYISSTGKEDVSDEEDDEDDDSLSGGEEAKKESGKEKASGKKSKEAHLRKQEVTHNGSEDDVGQERSRSTPLSGESLTDFYTRTSKYWNQLAADSLGGSELSSKDLKREGFKLAQTRFEEVLQRMGGLSLSSKEKKTTEDKHESKKKSKKSSKK